MDDAVCGFEWDLTGLAPGATQHFRIILADCTDGDRSALDTQLATIPTDPTAALTAARAEWDAFFARAKVPPGASADETAVYRQQLAILRMGQVRADGPGSGRRLRRCRPVRGTSRGSATSRTRRRPWSAPASCPKRRRRCNTRGPRRPATTCAATRAAARGSARRTRSASCATPATASKSPIRTTTAPTSSSTASGSRSPRPTPTSPRPATPRS